MTKPHPIPTEWLDFIIQQNPRAIIILDKARVIRYANRAAAKMAGVKDPKQVLGESYLDILDKHTILNEDTTAVTPEDLPSNRAFAEGKEILERVLAQITPEGHHYWLSISCFPYKNDNGKVESVAIVYDDISQAKLSEGRLRFMIGASHSLSLEEGAEARLINKSRYLVPALADWCTVNLVRHGRLRRIAVIHRDPKKVPLVEELAEIAASAPGDNAAVRRVIRNKNAELFPLATPDTVKAGTPARTAELWRELRPHSALIVPIINRDKVVGVLSLAYAESLRVYTENDRQFMQRFAHHLGVVIENSGLYDQIEERDQAKDRFLAALSHELRNPLAPIKHALELIRIQHAGEDMGEELALLEHQFDHLSKLLNDLLDITRYAQSKIRLTRTSLELRELLAKIVEMQRPFFEKRGIQLEVFLSEEPAWVSADGLRIEQAILNIVHNAEKFTPPGGRITLTLQSSKGAVHVKIRDTGIGIKKDELEKIFDPYFQGSHSSEKGNGGLGMGLALVREIVRLHGGAVKATSPGPGRGSTFTITLPLIMKDTDAQKNTAPADEIAKIATGAKKVLVVDDNVAATDSLVRLLNAIGFSAHGAYTAQEALELFKELAPDIAILDIGLPEMDGYQLVAELRRRGGNSFTAIALSGYGFPEDKKKSLVAGFDHHLTKPAGLADLQAVLSR